LEIFFEKKAHKKKQSRRKSRSDTYGFTLEVGEDTVFEGEVTSLPGLPRTAFFCEPAGLARD
jgi:hypothetical protein